MIVNGVLVAFAGPRGRPGRSASLVVAAAPPAARRRGCMSGSSLLFSIVAVDRRRSWSRSSPAVTLDRGLDNWFSDAHPGDRRRTRCRSPRPMWRSRPQALSADIAGADGGDSTAPGRCCRADPDRFAGLPDRDQARSRGVAAALFLDQERRLDCRAGRGLPRSLEVPPPPPTRLAQAAKPDEPVADRAGDDQRRSAAVVQLARISTTSSSMSRRPIDPKVLALSARPPSEAVARVPAALEATRFGIQLAFGILYLGMSRSSSCLSARSGSASVSPTGWSRRSAG